MRDILRMNIFEHFLGFNYAMYIIKTNYIAHFGEDKSVCDPLILQEKSIVSE